MIKLFIPFFIFLLASPVYSQVVPVPTPPPADEKDVVKITTALIQIDVTVTDKKGNIITDLRPDEIEIFENGEKQDITKFSFVANIRPPNGPRKTKENREAAAVPRAPLRPENVRRSIALVVDDLTLSFASAFFVQKALRKFVDEQMQDGDLVAIIRTGAGVGALQQFTSDRRQLHAAIDRVKWNAMGSGKIGTFAPLEARMERDEPDSGAAGPLSRDNEKEFDDFRESLFAAGTLGAIGYVVRGMSDLPGRKSVLLLSDGFPLYFRDRSGMVQSSRVLQGLRQLVDLANRAAVVIYTLDAKGLEIGGFTAQDDLSGRSFQDLDRLFNDRRNQVFDTQEGLRYLAHQTGGIPILNNNDIGDGIQQVLDDQSYYLVAYEPDDSTFNAQVRRFNKLEIKVKRPNVRVRYRSGFFGITDENLNRAKTPEQRLLYALRSPFAANDIGIRLNALYQNQNVEKDGNVIRSLVHINAQDLKFDEQPDGSMKATFDIFAVGYGDNGIAVDQRASTYSLTLKKDRFERAMKTGFVYDFSFLVKKPGAYQLRIALRDHGTDGIGSANQFVEVPNLKKDRLVLSGVILENLDYAEWKRRDAGEAPTKPTDPLTDTSLRQFRRGTVLNYGFTVFNAKTSATGPNLSFQTRVFRDGKQIYEGKVQPAPTVVRDPKSVQFTSAFVLGTAMEPGDYVLQVTITDNNAKGKRNSVHQFVQFEIVD